MITGRINQIARARRSPRAGRGRAGSARAAIGALAASAASPPVGARRVTSAVACVCSRRRGHHLPLLRDYRNRCVARRSACALRPSACSCHVFLSNRTARRNHLNDERSRRVGRLPQTRQSPCDGSDCPDPVSSRPTARAGRGGRASAQYRLQAEWLRRAAHQVQLRDVERPPRL